MADKKRIDVLREFAKALEDRPLDPAKPEDRAHYVETLHLETDKAGIHRDPIRRLVRKIDRAEGGGHVWFYTGNIGTGKSTELRRLKQELEQAGHLVLLADAQDYMHLHSVVEISDFLMAISSAYADAASGLLGTNEARESYWRRMTNVLTKTKIGMPEATAKVGLPELGEAEFKAAIRSDPTYKQRLQERMQAHLSTLVDEAHGLFAEIAGKLRAKFGADKKVVLLFDNMERIRGSGAAADTVFSSLRSMFTQFSDMLRLPEIQVLYSVPPYLGRIEPQLLALFGQASVCSLTYAHVFDLGTGKRKIDATGVELLRGLVAKRFPDWEGYLPRTELDRLIVYSGGDLRDLFRFIKDVLLELEDDVAPADAVEYVVGQVRRTMTWVVGNDEERLKKIARTKALQRDDQAEMDAFVRDMETKRVLMYLNGDEWYDIHPLLWQPLDPENAPEGYA